MNTKRDLFFDYLRMRLKSDFKSLRVAADAAGVKERTLEAFIYKENKESVTVLRSCAEKLGGDYQWIYKNLREDVDRNIIISKANYKKKIAARKKRKQQAIKAMGPFLLPVVHPQPEINT